MPGHGGWHARLALAYRRDGERTIAHDRHEGPLRVLQALYPEGPGICHHVIVHPPGGVVGGDSLTLEATLEAGCHALITTPGATRFYRSDGRPALQSTQLRLGAQARLEWLPLETIAYRGCLAENRVRILLDPSARMIGWDLLALGLPAADAAFDGGSFLQQIALEGVWLERGRVDGRDQRLLDSPLGWAGRRVLATAWFAAGTPIDEAERDLLLDAAREEIAADPLQDSAGATAPQPSLVVVRALAARVEPALQLLTRIRARWRRIAWDLAAPLPRVWRT